MDEFKAGDRVRMTVDPPHTGYVRDNGTVEELTPPNMVRVKWDSGFVQTVYAGNLQRSESTEELRRKLRDSWNERLSIQSNSYQEQLRLAAQRTELQAALTKRNATIGRLRAANRELRRELRSIQKLNLNGPPGLSSSVVYSQAPPSHAEYDRKVVQIDPSEPEPTPLPTAPPRVGGVYRTRGGDTLECLRIQEGDPDLAELKSPRGNRRWFYTEGRYVDRSVQHFDLVAEISPPPEPAFTGPLEVGGWYEDEKGRVCHCVSAHWLLVDNDVQFCCDRDSGSDFFRANGRTMSGNGPRIIRKVDPPGGES